MMEQKPLGAEELVSKHGVDMLSAQLLILLGKAKQGDDIEVERLKTIEESIDAGFNKFISEYRKKIQSYYDLINEIRTYANEDASK